MDGKAGRMALGCLFLGSHKRARGLGNSSRVGIDFFLLVSTDVHSLQRYSYSDDLGLLVDTTSAQGLDSSSTDGTFAILLAANELRAELKIRNINHIFTHIVLVLTSAVVAGLA
jgi:hypothetical protein